MFGVQARQVNESSHAFEVDRQPDHFVKLSIGVIRLAKVARLTYFWPCWSPACRVNVVRS